MTSMFITCLLAGDTAMTEAFREGFVQIPTQRQMGNLGWIALAGALVVIVVALLSRRGNKAPPRESRADYLTLLVDVLALSEEQRRDLLEAARRSGFSHPGIMLLSPRALALAAAEARNPQLRERLNQLALHLFAEPLPKVAEAERTKPTRTTS